jgi:predicted RNA-binding Zn-ribbon protein involved in translation (DUF1610 family)
MPEQFTPVDVVRINYLCDKCGKAHVEWSHVTLTSCPPWYPHKCPACGDVVDLRRVYPSIGYVDRKESGDAGG